MLFSSSQFLFSFLPVCLLVYFLVHRSRVLSNIALTAFSCWFYAYGEPKFIVIMLLLTTVDWIAALAISRSQVVKIRRAVLVAGVSLNLLILFIFKYLDFVIAQISVFFANDIPLFHIALPIGISFFTFQSISYVIDVYCGRGKAQKNLLYVVEYIALFPQLIAGPIVRYSDVATELTERRENMSDFEAGCCRFIIGLSKKVLLANSFAVAADSVFDTLAGGTQIAVLTAWIGAISYSLQIYFDFSGYSDMAIGLGRILGFHFLENFNYPYASKSITEFWRRWHISLGSWFRDYVYIPLGGSRVSAKRRTFNLLVVWALTGIWHGANWTFVAWGMMYFVLLWVEKTLNMPERIGCFSRIYTLLFVMLGWVIFRSPSIGTAIEYIMTMFGVGSNGLTDMLFEYVFAEYGWLLVIGCVGSFPVAKCCAAKTYTWIKEPVYIVGSIAMLMLSVSFLVKGAYNPFIYFNF